jgi:hypothetical protein
MSQTEAQYAYAVGYKFVTNEHNKPTISSIHIGVNAHLQSSRLILNQIKTIVGSRSSVILTGDLIVYLCRLNFIVIAEQEEKENQ